MCCALTAGVRVEAGVGRDARVLGLVAAEVEVGAGLPRIAGAGWARDRDAVAGVLAAGAGWGAESLVVAVSAVAVSAAGVDSVAGVSVAADCEMGGMETGGMDGVSVALGGVVG